MPGLKLVVLCLLASLACCEQEMNVKDDFGTYNENIKPGMLQFLNNGKKI